MRLLTTLLTAASLGFATTQAVAQDYPTRPVTIVVAYPAGQGTDVATRYLADQVSRDIGQPIVIDNRAGAAGNIGTAFTARAASDGYTLTMGTNATHVLNQYLFANIGYDPVSDFEPVLLVGTFPMVVAVNDNSPFTSVTDLVEAVKNDPRAADIAMPSTTARLVVELLKEQTGAPLYGIPYRGSGNAMTDVLGEVLSVTVDTPTALRPHLSGERVRAIGVTSSKPSELVPGVPPVAEQGFDGFEVIAWNALYAPKGTPESVISTLNDAFNKVLAKPETRQRLLEMGFEAAGGTPDVLRDFTDGERTKWEPLIDKAGIRLE